MYHQVISYLDNLSSAAASMADPLSIASGTVALVTAAFNSSITLYITVRALQGQDKRARALKGELGELSSVLESLLETVNNNPELDLKALDQPLRRCGNACREYGEIIAQWTQYSNTRSSFLDWGSQRYMHGDITEFKDMLATYKSTFRIALALTSIRGAATTAKVLEDYQDMIRDTTCDLQEHLQLLEDKVEQSMTGDPETSKIDALEWQAILQEKASTQRGLKLCAEVSAQIKQFDIDSKEHLPLDDLPSAQIYSRSGLFSAGGSIHSLISRLNNHETEIDQRIKALKSEYPISPLTATQLTQLQDSKETIRHCISVVSNASIEIPTERRNIFEDIVMTDETYDFSISTVGDLVTARRINLKGRACHIGGQLTDESYQKTIDALTQVEITGDSRRQLDPVPSQPESPTKEKDKNIGAKRFSNRHGPGLPLAMARKPPVITGSFHQQEPADVNTI